MKRRPTVLAPLPLFVFLACGPAEEPTPPSADTPSPAAPGNRSPRRREVPAAEVLALRPGQDGERGTLTGEVRFAGEPPERFPIGARKNRDCQHFPEVEHLSDTKIVHEGKLVNAYVYLRDGVPSEGLPPVPAEPAVLDQRGCMYLPHVLALRAGQVLRVANSDPTNHNVNFRAPRNGLSGNRNMGRGQEPLELVFEKRELGIRFKCDIHPWMGAVVHVQEHPWFDVTDGGGRFRIEGVPPGDYVVEVLHEVYGRVRGRVTVEAGTELEVAFSLDG